MIVPKTHIILGITELDKNKFRPVKNDFVKPKGGLWAAPYTPNREYVSPWHEWCVSEEFDSGLSNDAVIINLKDNSNVYVIDSQLDLCNLINFVGEYKNEYYPTKLIDFEKASRVYDAIFLTDEGQCDTRIPILNPRYNLYGWDCESILIMNFDCIENWEYKKLNIIKEEL